MFDDEKKEPNDMFEETDKAAPQVTPPTTPAPAPAQTPAPAPAPAAASTPAPETTPAPAQNSIQDRMADLQVAKRGFPLKPIVLVLAIVVIIAGAFFLSMKILNSRTPETPTSPNAEDQTTSKEVKQEFTSDDTGAAEKVSDLDSDKDGLTDLEEAELGTSPTSEDTDADGLFDREEVQVYKTDPLNPDTDGDTFTDGGEVESGYNPKGDGLLLNLPK
jgi:hypothetical protein